MRIELFELRFNNHHAIYTSGQVVTGSVVIKLTKTTWIHCVLIKFSGKAKSRWEVNTGDSTRTYQANEVYIDNEYCLYLSQNATDRHSPGTHVYPFDFTLPPEVPSSFEGRRGFIRYNCVVALDRGWKGRLEVEQDLAVIRHLDVGALPDAGLPVNEEEDDSYEGCCCHTGMVSAALRLQKRGFVSGEPCNFDIYVNNQATSSIRGVCLILVQTVHYTGYSHSLFSSGNPKYHDKVNNWTLFELEEEVGSMRTSHFSNCCVIPAVAPSLLEGCNIIEIMYEIQMQVPVGWRTMSVSSPIYIGTIPLRLSQNDNENSLDDSTSPPVRTTTQDAPPSYEECVFGRMESQEGHQHNPQDARPYVEEDGEEETSSGVNTIANNTSSGDLNSNSAASRRSRFHRLPSYPYYSLSHFTSSTTATATTPTENNTVSTSLSSSAAQSQHPNSNSANSNANTNLPNASTTTYSSSSVLPPPPPPPMPLSESNNHQSYSVPPPPPPPLPPPADNNDESYPPLLPPTSQEDQSSSDALAPPPSYESLQNYSMDANTRLITRNPHAS